MKPLYSLTPISDHAKELLAAIDKNKEPQELLYTEGQVKGLEAMYGYNRAQKLYEHKIKDVASGYRNTSFLIPNNRVQDLQGTYFEDCILEFDNQDFAGKLYDQGCRFRNCRVIYHLHANKVQYTLNRE